ncbi:TetR/AcrR family transcriptional regulator [Microcella sp.]|uniref:TetR/AcrR family transcriptional regulator n=1 Tax=Microcella sp. TaxID=1913979 RepID=UPI003F715C78
MRSASTDPTTRDRIRDAALALFGSRGFDGASVRDIAERAEVSPALVMHHFGSKEALRAECDALIVDEVLGRKESLHAGEQGDLASTMQRWLADVDTHRASLDYLARMITDGSPAGDRLFDDLVARTRAMIAQGAASGMMRESSDPQMTAVIVAAHGLIPLLLEHHLGRAIGEQGLTPAAVRRMTLPTLELYTHGLYRSTAILEAAEAALAGTPDTSRGPRSDKGAGDPNQDPDPPAAPASDP